MTEPLRTQRTPITWVDVVVETSDNATLRYLCRFVGGHAPWDGPWTARLTTVQADAVDAFLAQDEEARQKRAEAAKTLTASQRLRAALDRKPHHGRDRRRRDS